MITAICPNCNTQYQLTQEQLNVAGGQVRCGACMTVFDAQEHQAPSKAKAAEDDFLIDDDFSLDEPEKVVEEKPSTMRQTQTGSFYLFDEDNLSDSFKNIDTSKQYLGDEVIPSDEAEGDDESWADQLLEEEEAGIEKPASKPEPKADKVASSIKKAAKKHNAQAKPLSADKPATEQDDEADIGLPLGDKKGLIDRIQPEPLELNIGGGGRLLACFAWFCLLLLLGAGLLAQLLFFQFEKWSHQPQWRPVYRILCQHLECELPSLYNIDDISAQHLSVNSHKVYKGALVVDAVLLNQSDIAQPFPHLELFFTDSSNQVVAAKRFAPAEYLHGELKGKAMMPAKQPIRIALEIIDPGKQASGYYLQLRE